MAKLWLPDRVTGKHVFIVAANPTLEFGACLIGNNLYAVMHAPYADPFLYPLIDHLQPSPLFLNGFMSFSSVHIENDCSSVFENVLIFGPAIQYNFCLYSRNVL